MAGAPYEAISGAGHLTTSRRGLFRTAAMSLGGLASAPLVLAAVSQQAFGQGLPQRIVERSTSR